MMMGMTKMASTATPPTSSKIAPPCGYDVILASDCFYDTHNFEDVVVTIATLLQMHPNVTRDDVKVARELKRDSDSDASPSLKPPELWMTYQERSSGRSIRHFLAKYGLYCVREISWRHFVESESSEEERKQLEELECRREIDSIWILVIRMKEGF